MSLFKNLFKDKSANIIESDAKIKPLLIEVKPDIDRFTINGQIDEINQIKDYLLAFDEQSNFVYGESYIEIKNEFLYAKDEFGDQICSLHNLGLSQINDTLYASIEDKSNVNNQKYQIGIEVKSSKNNKSGDVVGAFFNYAGNISVVPEVIYKINQDICIHNNSIKTADNNWKAIVNIKEKAKLFPSQILFREDSFLKNQNPVMIDKIAIHSNLDQEGNIAVTPTFPQASDSMALNQHIDQFKTVLRQHEINGQKYILSDKAIAATQQIKEKSLLKSISEKQDFIDNPLNIYDKLLDVVDLSLFSERVIGFGINEDSVKININNDNNWTYPLPIELYDNNNELVSYSFEKSEEVKGFIEMVNNCFIIKQSYFHLNSNIIPFNNSNIQELKKIMSFSIEESNTLESESYRDSITVVNINNQEIKVIKSKLKSLARKIDKFIQEGDNSGNTLIYAIEIEYLLESDTRQKIQLTRQNLLIIFKNIRRGLIIQELEFTKLVEQIIVQSNLLNVARIPPTLKIPLKSHQDKGIAWLQNCYKLNRDGLNYQGVLLADDMGLGKTLQVLSFLERLGFDEKIKKPHLIIAPVILLDNWQDEYKKFFNGANEPYVLNSCSVKQFIKDKNLKNDQFGLAYGKNKIPIRLDINLLRQKKIIVVNYDTLVEHQTSFAAIDWHVVVLDEAQNIKTPWTQQTKVTKTLKAEFKIAMTGTPVENSMLDVWSIFDFLNEGLLLPLQQFKREYNKDSITNEAISKLKQQLFFGTQYSYMLRRLKKNVLRDFVSKEVKTHKIDYDSLQLEKYKKLMQDWVHNPKRAIEFLPLINNLHQNIVLLGGEYTELDFKKSKKAQKLIEIVSDIRKRGDKVLIFAILIEMQNYLKELLSQHFNVKVSIINGNTASSKRRLILSEFEEKPDQFVMILSPKAAGVGLNIVSANHIIHYGRWWNPAVESQATDRAYRIGQTKTVYVHYLIHVDKEAKVKSFDEKLHNLLKEKVGLADEFLNIQQNDLSKELIEKLNNS